MIAKKPAAKKKTATSKEAKAQKFIKNADQPQNGNGRLQPVMMKIDRGILAIIDAKADGLGLSRTAFMITSATMKVEELESEAAQGRFILAAHKAKADSK
jgi:uncharacterized protein (DUF1778 family)